MTTKNKRKNFDKLMGYISVKGSGDSKEFKNACSTLSIKPAWLVRENLCILGHMESSTIRKGWWSCSKPSLSILPSKNKGALCGARSRKLLEKIKKKSEFNKVENNLAPDSWIISTDDLKSLINVSSELGLKCYETPTSCILSKSLPRLSDYVGKIVEKTSGGYNYEESPKLWDSENKSWEYKKNISENGLWQIEEKFKKRKTFILRIKDEKYEVGDLNAVKFYLLKSRNKVFSYNADEAILKIEKGLRLPRVYSRVLCLCSGLLPEENEREYLYKNVPPTVARNVADRLGVGFSGERP